MGRKDGIRINPVPIIMSEGIIIYHQKKEISKKELNLVFT